ncbi:MAG: hypothetical protein IJO76_07460 [Clostridia bacterium]|nr:hypothetical protein [Clostridia bacterium]
MKQEENRPTDTPSNLPVFGEAVDVWEQINKYGTYEVQDTTDTDNTFPAIGPHHEGQVTLPLPDAVLDKQRPEKA